MKYVFILVLVFCVAQVPEASAQQAAQQLGVCLTDSLSGKERKLLARWIYFGMSAHSSIKPYSKATEKDVEQSNQFLGGLITRLLTKDCPTQAKAAYQERGARSFEQAFRVVGEVAMKELMTEPSVTQALGAFEQYMDKSQFEKAFNDTAAGE